MIYIRLKNKLKYLPCTKSNCETIFFKYYLKIFFPNIFNVKKCT